MSGSTPFAERPTENPQILEPTVVITGPTAGGKGRLATRVARRLGTGIISLDSMKVYRGMDIGTAKPSRELLASLPFHLIDIREPWEAFSIGDYLDELTALGLEPSSPRLFAGGTGFYLNVLLRGIFRGPPPDEDLRRELRVFIERKGARALHRRLAAEDPEAAEQIDATDARRIIRALEVMAHAGELFSVLKRRRRPILPEGRFRLVGIARSRADLYDRINRRVDRMFGAGWVEEVAALVAEHDPPWSPQADQSIGYGQIRTALSAGEDPRERIPVIQSRTRQFARHQLIWFRRMPIEWWSVDEEDALLDDLERSLGDCREHGVFPAVDPARLANEDL